MVLVPLISVLLTQASAPSVSTEKDATPRAAQILLRTTASPSLVIAGALGTGVALELPVGARASLLIGPELSWGMFRPGALNAGVTSWSAAVRPGVRWYLNRSLDGIFVGAEARLSYNQYSSSGSALGGLGSTGSGIGADGTVQLGCALHFDRLVVQLAAGPNLSFTQPLDPSTSAYGTGLSLGLSGSIAIGYSL